MRSNGFQIAGAGNFEEIALLEHKPMEWRTYCKYRTNAFEFKILIIFGLTSRHTGWENLDYQ